jgi:hypothetical protein
MDNNEFLFEGMVERMSSVSAYSTEPYILWEEHATERVFKDRDFISDAKIKGLNPTTIKEDLIKELKMRIGAIQSEWNRVNPKVTNTKRMPRFEEVNFIIRKPYKLNYHDKKLNRDMTIMIEATVQGSLNTLFSIKHKDEVREIWFNTQGDADAKFDAINKFLATKTSVFKSDILQGKLGFNKPYLFIETFVLGLIHPTKFPITFSGGSTNKNITWYYANSEAKKFNITFYQYLDMYRKARSLPKMKGLIDLVPAKEIKQLLDINKEGK